MARLIKASDLFSKTFGEFTPTCTWVEIKALFHPKQLVEINGIAVLDEKPHAEK
jgi:hypothetical protein